MLMLVMMVLGPHYRLQQVEAASGSAKTDKQESQRQIAALQRKVGWNIVERPHCERLTSCPSSGPLQLKQAEEDREAARSVDKAQIEQVCLRGNGMLGSLCLTPCPCVWQ